MRSRRLLQQRSSSSSPSPLPTVITTMIMVIITTLLSLSSLPSTTTMAFVSHTTTTRDCAPATAAAHHHHSIHARSANNDRIGILLLPRSKMRRSATPPPSTTTTTTTTVLYHGPDDDATARPVIEVSEEERTQLKSEFSKLLHTVLDETMAEEELPGLFAQNIDMILKVIGMEVGGGLLEEIIREEVTTTTGNVVSEEGSGSRLDRITEAVNLILAFVETFVEETSSMDATYKRILGNIFQNIAPTKNNQSNNNDVVVAGASSSSSSSSSMEDRLDEILSVEAEASLYTPGFLRHIEGECERLSSNLDLENDNNESARMLEILRLIQTRVLEELGKGIGEGAVVLGQLLGYDDEAERMAVLDAGLAVRGVEFARELRDLTGEALEGFERVDGGVDPGLVEAVKAMDERIGRFVARSEEEFQ